MLVKPAPGRSVRDPRSMALLPETGREVPDHDSFWLRRLRDGDVTKDEAPPSPAPKAPPAHARHEPAPHAQHKES